MLKLWQTTEHVIAMVMISAIFMLAVAGVWSLSPVAYVNNSAVAGASTQNQPGEIRSNLLGLEINDLQALTQNQTQLVLNENRSWKYLTKFETLPNSALSLGKLQLRNPNLAAVEVKVQAILPSKLAGLVVYVKQGEQIVQLQGNNTNAKLASLVLPGEESQVWELFAISDRTVYFSDLIVWELSY
jgi:hypothetical protein